jgi:hypothetical protein
MVGLYPGPGAGDCCAGAVPNEAALALLATSQLSLGATAWVETIRTWARLDTAANAGALVPDEVFAADSASFRWVRMETPRGAWRDALMHCDPTNGNNENPGTLALPLKDAAEFFRRNVEAVLTDYELRYVAGAAPVDIVGTMRSSSTKWTRVLIRGTPTVAASGAVTSIAAPVEATNTEAKLAGPVADWAPYVTAQSLLRTTLPSNALSYSAVGTQAVLGTAETAPWVTVSQNAAGVYTSTGTAAAPAVAATVEVLSGLPQPSGEVRLCGDAGIVFAFQEFDLTAVPNGYSVDCRSFFLIGCRFGSLPIGSASQCPAATCIGGVIPGTAATTFLTSLRFNTFVGTACFRTGAFTVGETRIVANGFCFFGAAPTFGNTVGGQGPSTAVECLNGGGGCIGLMVFNPVANANSNPGADCIVIRGGAWVNAVGVTGPIMGRANAAGSVFVRVWAGGTLEQGPGYTSKGTGVAFDFQVGAFGASPATIMPPIEVAGAAPPPLALPAAAGAAWAMWNAATPAGFSRYLNWRGSVLLGAQ